ncbi:hypothetical protein NKH99_28290 [Mesorhizobium sp. M0854]|uniref:hypothetical protein n=1 Tax=Mesorhizobium sp. M0854 TaxID=2957013 RepID=UPI00333CC824
MRSILASPGSCQDPAQLPDNDSWSLIGRIIGLLLASRQFRCLADSLDKFSPNSSLELLEDFFGSFLAAHPIGPARPIFGDDTSTEDALHAAMPDTEPLPQHLINEGALLRCTKRSLEIKRCPWRQADKIDRP